MATNTSHIPTRTCIACRTSTDVGHMERFVLMDQHLIHDLRRKAPGRGAHVHVKCLGDALKRKAFSRAFKTQVKHPSLEVLHEQMADAILLRLKETVTTAVRAQRVAIGQNQVREHTQRVALLFIAPDGGKATVQKFERNAQRKGIVEYKTFNATELGSLCGQEHTSVLGVLDAVLAQKIVNDYDNLRQLGV